FLLIDDASNTSLGSRLEDLRQFINAQPATGAIRCRLHQKWYCRHRTEQYQRPPASGQGLAAPVRECYCVRQPLPVRRRPDLIKRRPEAAIRREVLMISDGHRPVWWQRPG